MVPSSSSASYFPTPLCEVLFPVWSHEAVVTRAPDGTYVAFMSYNVPCARPQCKTCKESNMAMPRPATMHVPQASPTCAALLP